jgi:hypothetical protein
MIDRINILSKERFQPLMRFFGRPATVFWILSGSILLLVIRWILLIKQYAVNILFSDLCDINNPIFTNLNVWQLFTYQHGPHRQGIGELLIKVLSTFSQWNTIVDSYASLGLIFAALIAALVLKRRLFKRWSLFDVVIPIIFLTVSQYETILVTPNESHSAFPLLLILLFALAWTNYRRIWRYPLALIINFLAIFTGFGIFLGVITPVMFANDLYHSLLIKERRRSMESATGLFISILSLLAFFNHYVFSPSLGCLQIRFSYLPRYPIFMSVIMGRFLGINYASYHWLSIEVGAAILTATAITFLIHAWNSVRKPLYSETSPVITILSGFTLLFILNAAVGRQCLGMGAAYPSRYVTLTIPGLFALYLFLQTLKPLFWHKMLVATFILVIAFSLPLKKQDSYDLKYYSDGKIAWKTCYIQVEDVEQCNAQANFWVYPTDANLIQTRSFVQKLDYLRVNHLNLYLGNQAWP